MIKLHNMSTLLQTFSFDFALVSREEFKCHRRDGIESLRSLQPLGFTYVRRHFSVLYVQNPPSGPS